MPDKPTLASLLYASKQNIEDVLKVISDPSDRRIYERELALVNKDIAEAEKQDAPGVRKFGGGI